jgi:hypothetical protein
MHSLDQIIARNQRAQAAHDAELLAETRHNIELLDRAPMLNAYEMQILHYSRVIVRLAAGESFEFVARQMGAAFPEREVR